MRERNPAVLNAGHYYHVRGGSDRYMVSLGELLESKGHTVVPFAVRDPENRESPWTDRFPDPVDVQNGGLRDAAQFLYSRPAERALRSILSDTPVDVAHLHIYYGQLTTSILRPLRERGIPIVQTLHDYKLACPVYTMVAGDRICEACRGKSFLPALPRRCNRGSLARTLVSVAESYVSRLKGRCHELDHFIAPSDFMRRKMIELDLVDPDRITAIPHHVDLPPREESPAPGKHILYFGRIESVKGVRTLIEAAGPLRECRLVIAGRGGGKAEMESLVERQGWDHIRFVGFQSGEDLERLIRESIATVLPSEWYENYPLAIMESHARSRPVIGAIIGGIPEMIDDGTDGFLFPPGDVEALRDALERATGDLSAAVRMGEAGRRRAEERYDADLHYDRILEVYRRVL
ncbi:MAG: glycosyltransferase family 4 protein [Gemmatimonadota bacterium]|nr:glycosyltransferase family 4 protein [Gemmatimonadota bacterium]MDP6802836.1 glycosyltransferase family 4 protein [Gemmatimonadota bacterium]